MKTYQTKFHKTEFDKFKMCISEHCGNVHQNHKRDDYKEYCDDCIKVKNVKKVNFLLWKKHI